jgi:hypothetical protein
VAGAEGRLPPDVPKRLRMSSTFDRWGCVGGEEAVVGVELIEELGPNISARRS